MAFAEAVPQVGLDDERLQSEWLAVAASREVERGQLVPRRIMRRDLVLWRGADGAIHCWLDLCIHRGAKLSLGTVKHDCVVCPYHAWEYDGSGACVRIPAQPNVPPPLKARAQTFTAEERYGMVWVRFGGAGRALPEFPLAEEARVRNILAGPYRFHAKGPRVMENLFDVAHLGFVHAGLLGDPEHAEMEDYEVGTGEHGPEAREVRIWQPDPDGTGKPALVTYRYWALGPLTAGIEKVHGAQRFGILSQVAPVDEEHCELRMVIAMNYGHEVSEDEMVRFQDRVTEQDRVVVESQRPELLPLDLQAELHLRSDRMAIAYRKWLREIGFGYGTA